MSRYVLALDQGTTSSRAILFDNEQNIIAVRQREFEQIYPQQGWVEHDPMEIWSTQYGVMNEVVAQSGVDAMTLPPSASPTSARPPSCGKGHRPPHLQRHRLAVPPHAPLVRRASGQPGMENTSARRPAWCRTPIFPPPR